MLWHLALLLCGVFLLDGSENAGLGFVFGVVQPLLKDTVLSIWGGAPTYSVHRSGVILLRAFSFSQLRKDCAGSSPSGS